MTEQPHVQDRPTTPAAHTPCGECPWRAANVGKKHPEEEWYTAHQWTTGWRDISQNGGVSPCHLFLPMGWKDEWADQGYQKPTDTGANKECAGAAALVQREVTEAENYGSWEEYHQARPTGLSREAFAVYLARTTGKAEPEFRAPEHVTDDELTKPEDVIDTTSPAWKYSPATAEALIRAAQAVLPQTRGDDRGAFPHHRDAHDHQPLTTAEGITVHVDTDLHPLLTALARVGVRSLASCHNLRHQVETSNPHRLAPLMRRPVRGTLNYETPLRTGEAFIRVRNDSPTEQAFIDAATGVPGVTVETVSLQTQLTFPLDQTPRLEALADALTA